MATLKDLHALLLHRENVIADHPWRDRDPSDHLAALKQVSEQISNWPEAYVQPIDPKLKHYLANASYAKARAHLEPLL